MEKQFTRFICIIYPKEYNGTGLLMHKACTKQLASPPSNFGPKNYNNPHLELKGLISGATKNDFE